MKQRVLIVDDDAVVRESIRKVLKGAGYEVKTAADVEEATAKFVPEETDIVLLDLNLRSRSGWDLFERFTTQYPMMPVIIITGLPNQYQTAVAAGVGALIEKPIEVPALLKTMAELLAEPHEGRIRRLSGSQLDTRYLRRPCAEVGKKLSSPAIRARRRGKPNATPS